MGGYQKGADPELDRAIEIVPKLYETMKQSLTDPLSVDPFQEIARALSESREEPPKPASQQR
jgi:flagellum-specific ATP synthase